MSNQQPPITTTDAGSPVASDEHSLTVGPGGPNLLQDSYLNEKLAHFVRERIPDRPSRAAVPRGQRLLEERGSRPGRARRQSYWRITGRNHHSTGFGVISDLSTRYPGYDSIIGPQNATIGAMS